MVLLFYSLFPEKKLCIFSAAGELSRPEMKLCLQELATESAWPNINTIVVDLRGCYGVDQQFSDDFSRYRMEQNAFGSRRLFWLTGSSTVLGHLTMAANSSPESALEPRVFHSIEQLGLCLGSEGTEIMQCLAELD